MRVMLGPLRWISVDPSLHRMGWCVWHGHEPLTWGLLESSQRGKNSWKAAVTEMSGLLRLRWSSCHLMVIEFPEEMGGRRGRASLNSGAVRKLTYLVGRIAGGFLEADPGRLLRLAEPSKWKGQVPKNITRKRVLRDYPQVGEWLEHDVYDAIGIGRWFVKKGNR